MHIRLNNVYLCDALDAAASRWDDSLDNSAPCSILQRAHESEPLMLSRLPVLSSIKQDAKRQAKRLYTEACITSALADSLVEGTDKQDDLRLPPAEEEAQTASPAKRRKAEDSETSIASSNAAVPRKPLQGWQLLQAIEKKNLTTIFEARDHAFPLLVTSQSGSLPLLFCLRIGASHRDIAILLVGAISKWVNNLDADKKPSPATTALLRAVRTNLKLAINESLSRNDTDLISSYLQVVVMSQGDKWIRDQGQAVGLALRQGKPGAPVQTAEEAVLRFATAELRTLNKTASISSVDDYISNATADLVVMGLMSCLIDTFPSANALPTYQFARDDRLFKTFQSEMTELSRLPNYHKLSKTLRDQIRQALKILNTRTVSHRAKVEKLALALDGENRRSRSGSQSHS